MRLRRARIAPGTPASAAIRDSRRCARRAGGELDVVASPRHVVGADAEGVGEAEAVVVGQLREQAVARRERAHRGQKPGPILRRERQIVHVLAFGVARGDPPGPRGRRRPCQGAAP
jgi:hypothetical protein